MTAKVTKTCAKSHNKTPRDTVIPNACKRHTETQNDGKGKQKVTPKRCKTTTNYEMTIQIST